MELIREKAYIVTKDQYKTDRIAEDPNDNKFLGCALEAKVNYVVSGDSHLLSLKDFHGIQGLLFDVNMPYSATEADF